MLDFLAYPFMLRALAAGAITAVLLGWLGAFVTTRKMSFIGDGVAHASLTGIAMALLLNWPPIPVAVCLAVFLAIGIYFLECQTKISADMAIAIVFTTGMAIGIILLNFNQSYQPELISYLFGNILIVDSADLWSVVIFGAVILLFLTFLYNRLLFVTFDRTGAYLSGLRPWIYDLMLYVATAVSVVLSVKLVGIVLVSSLLVIPSAIARLFSSSFRYFNFLSVALAVGIVVAGTIFSYWLDLPTGAVIILTGAILLIVSYLIKNLKQQKV